MSEFGFIIVRYVNSRETNEYWKQSYLAIRRYYPANRILIVDDASDKQFLCEGDFETTQCTVIESEFPRRGELLGYYYFYQLKPFAKAIILHDSVFINRQLNCEHVKDIQFLWSFDHQYDDEMRERRLLMPFESAVHLMYNNKSKWFGCYGVMSVVSLEFIEKLNVKYNIFAHLLPLVTSRQDRMALERVFACICTLSEPELSTSPHLLGDIHQYRWGRNISFAQYLQGQNADMPAVKILTGR